MTPRTRRILTVALLAAALTGCKDLKIQTQDKKDEFRFGSPAHMWVTYKKDVVPDSVPVRWSSDRDGHIGDGPDVSFDALSAGKHEITATCEHDGKKGKAKKKIKIQNDRPEPQIAEPTGGKYALNSMVRFVGSANDREDGSVPAEKLVWTSNKDGVLGSGAMVALDTLTPGVHEIKLSATDRANATGERKVTIEILNREPVAEISEPSGDRRINVGRSISFRGSAIDPDFRHGTMNIPADSLEWHSSRDGKIGSGFTATTDELSAGRHTIELRAKDEFGKVGKTSVEVEVINRNPTVKITSPDSGKYFSVSERVRFSADVEDPDGFDMDDDDIIWTSNKDGRLDKGKSFRTQTLSAGKHKITLEATDRHGGTSKTSIEIFLTNDAPVAEIVSPGNGDQFHWGDKIHLEGRGNDNEDGSLSGSNLEWTARTDGGGRKKLGDGRGRDVKVSDLGFGTHTIALRATDRDGGESEIVRVRITVPNREPKVQIAAPIANARLTEGLEAVFQGNGFDPDRESWAKDSDMSWTAQTNAGTTYAIGTGREVKVNNLPAGNFRIVLTVTDPDDKSLTASAFVFVTVEANLANPVTGATGPASTPNGTTTAGATGALNGLGN